MADNVKPTYSKTSVKSGNESEKYGQTVLGGIPEKKDVEQIDKENTPKNAPGSVRS